MAPDTILSALQAHAAAWPVEPALVTDDGALGWSETRRRVGQAAAAMAASGAGPGTRVALLTGSGPEAALAFLGAVAAGACAVPMPTSLRPENIAALLRDCAPVVTVADATGRDIAGAIGTLDCPMLAMESDLLSRPGEDLYRPMPEDAPFNIIYSSGTTGTPKGIVHSHGMRDGQARRKTFGLDPNSRMLLATPIYSNTTLMPFLASIFHGAAVRLMRKFDAGTYLGAAEMWRATHTMLVPVQYRRIMDHPDFGRFDLSAMRLKQSTSAKLDPDLKRDILARFPGGLIEVFGLTEGGVTAVLDARRFPDKLDTVGRPADGVEMKVVDAEDRELPQGEVGEIVGRSPWMMSGYWGRPDLTEAVLWTGGEGRAFFRSGDLGFFDAEGFLHLVGRKKDMINSGGFNVYPVDLEVALLSHPDVKEAAVFAIPSRAWGETPFGAVVLREGAAHDAEAIRAWANNRLGRMQKLDGIAIRADLPRSSIGKVLKTELAETYRERASQ